MLYQINMRFDKTLNILFMNDLNSSSEKALRFDFKKPSLIKNMNLFII